VLVPVEVTLIFSLSLSFYCVSDHMYVAIGEDGHLYMPQLKYIDEHNYGSECGKGFMVLYAVDVSYDNKMGANGVTIT